MAETIPDPVRKSLISKYLWLVVISSVALIERLLVIVVYQPVTYSDTNSYRRLADTVLKGFTNYDGTRTPGYPVFLALTGSDQLAWLVQLLLGFVTTLLLFYLGWRLTDKAWFGGLIALAHTLNLGQLFFESNLLTESITTFFLILTMIGVLVWVQRPKARSVWLAIALGLLSVITLLIRPLYIYLPFFLLAFLWLEARPASLATKQSGGEIRNQGKTSTRRLSSWSAAAFLAPVVVLLGGWLGFMHQQFNEWSLTTMTGYHLVQHTGNFFEYVPDEYASLRDTYLTYRNEHIAKFGTQTNAIWDAIPEMSRVSGYSFYALSNVLARISIQLIIDHPFLFIKSAISGWWMFWRAPVYWSADSLKIQALAPAIRAVIQLERPLVFLANLVFIVASLYFIFTEGISAIRRKSLPLAKRFKNPGVYSFLWMLLANIWLASILQTLLDHGDNPRFLIPMQSLVVLWVGVFIFQMITQRYRLPAASSQP